MIGSEKGVSPSDTEVDSAGSSNLPVGEPHSGELGNIVIKAHEAN